MSAAGSAGEICGDRGASTHPFDPGTVFPLEVRYRSDKQENTTAATSEPDITSAAVAAAPAAATTTPTTTTHGGMQPVLEHCCEPLMRGSKAGGVRGEGRRFSVWISFLTAGKNGGRMQHGG